MTESIVDHYRGWGRYELVLSVLFALGTAGLVYGESFIPDGDVKAILGAITILVGGFTALALAKGSTNNFRSATAHEREV